MTPHRVRLVSPRRKRQIRLARIRRRRLIWAGLVSCIAFAVVLGFVLIPRKSRSVPSEPEVKTRLEKLFELYKLYSVSKGQGPPHEQALKDFYATLPGQQKLMFGDDVNLLFQNPRDGAKYEIHYGVRVDPGTLRAVIWEKIGQDGRRYIALSIGYVVLKDEQEFNDSNK
jgi:hypothetical protein